MTAPLDVLLSTTAEHLRQSREQFLVAWQGSLGAGFKPAEVGLTEHELRDHMADLLGDLCNQMQRAVNMESEADALKHAEIHGDARWTQRYQLHQLVREIGALRLGVIERIVRSTAGASGEEVEAEIIAQRIVHRFFDTFMADSASLFAARHEHAMSERQRQRLAQELHDGVCQELQGARLMATVLV